VTRGDCERAVAAAARVDGIDLVPVGTSIGWLTQRGHLDLPENLSEPRERLAAIFEALSGDLTAQAAKRSIPLPGDVIRVATCTLLEVDEYPALHYVQAHDPGSLSARVLPGLRPRRIPKSLRAVVQQGSQISERQSWPRVSAKPGGSGNTPTTTLYVTSRPPRWVTRSYALTPPKATDRWHMSESANGCWQFLAELAREISSCSRSRSRLNETGA